MLSCTFDSETTTLCCAFEGRMDSQNSLTVQKRLEEHLAEVAAKSEGRPLKVVFQMGGVDYIASAFIRLCLQTAKSVEGEGFSIEATHPLVKKAFKMAGLDTLLRVS